MWHNNRSEHSNEIEKSSLKFFAEEGGGGRGEGVGGGVGGREERGISENSRLEFGKTITNHLKCELLSTNKQK